MRRVDPVPIVTDEEAYELSSELYPGPPCECKSEDWGRIDGRPVAADYADMANFPEGAAPRLEEYRAHVRRRA